MLYKLSLVADTGPWVHVGRGPREPRLYSRVRALFGVYVLVYCLEGCEQQLDLR